MAGPTHHLVEQVLRELVAAAAEQLGADLLIEFFGVEHEAVEVEDDGAGGGLRSKVQGARSKVESALLP